MKNADIAQLAPDCEPAPSPTHLAFAPVQLAWRSDGWTPERQRSFIEALADCGVVREAAARVGMTEQSAYGLRRRPGAEAFTLAWDTAVRMGTERLHSIALERAIAGTVKRRYFHGEVVGEERVFDTRLLIHLLKRMENPHRDWEAGHRMRDWHSWMNAVEDGLPKPAASPDEPHQSPVWRDEDGAWLTSFPPPEDFNGEQWGDCGEEDYCRELSPQERQAVDAWEQRTQAEAQRRRDRYFRRLTEV